jgi:hypothetical protein
MLRFDNSQREFGWLAGNTDEDWQVRERVFLAQRALARS